MKDYIVSPKRRKRLMKIAKYCANVRRMAGITQEQVAIDVGCSKSNVSAFEHGNNDSATIYQWYIDYERYADIPYAHMSGQGGANGK